ncbi:hypothetical protein D3C74_399730 [compost metagenome]
MARPYTIRSNRLLEELASLCSLASCRPEPIVNLHHSLDPAAFHDKTQSIVAGLQTVFGIEFILTILVLVLGWFINGRLCADFSQ